MLPSQAGAGFNPDDLTAEEKAKAGLDGSGRRMTTKQKKKAENEILKKQTEFKKIVGFVGFESKNVKQELDTVIYDLQKDHDKVKSTVNDNSWNWLSRSGSQGLANCSREEVMKYKDCFTDAQWEGMAQTWEIVEDRARTVEKKELGPLSKQLKLARRRKKKAAELASLCDEFLEFFDSIYDDLEEVEIEARAFMSNYNRLEDTSRSFKKHILYDDSRILKALKELLKGTAVAEEESVVTKKTDDDGSITSVPGKMASVEISVDQNSEV
ncbi:hypothetical protein TrLO_g1430 [Triparma laevis f. longispina]|uniref:Uncharacterized protein n=1 Tax=Triparma laevis f. longispina TaxID=1714387 RepID=A0A9W7FNP6_9STRA|nr:hypothetical protein TrLO_g1430 [Triparma laevis f. longispina]